MQKLLKRGKFFSQKHEHLKNSLDFFLKKYKEKILDFIYLLITYQLNS